MTRIRDAVDDLRESPAQQTDTDTDTERGQTESDRSQIQLSKPAPENTGNYFSSGSTPLTITETGDNYRRLELGVLAKTISLRFTDDIIVAFAKPYGTSNAIALTAEESPMTIGGDVPVDTAFIWIQQADTATTDPDVQIIALT